jgi:DNA helicase IV
MSDMASLASRQTFQKGLAHHVAAWRAARLLVLDASGCRVDDSGLGGLRALRSLVALRLRGNAIASLEALVDAADSGRAVTIAGDPAQKILADAQFEGFEQLLNRLTGQVEVRLDALAVGHRSTRPIMTLALAALDHAGGADPAVVAARDGEPVEWFEGDTGAEAAVEAVRRFRDERPNALVAVLAKGKSTADAWARRFTAAGLSGVRRAARSDFSFQPGVVVSNVHQVKGLEFDGVLLVEPAEFGAPDRHLLHVAITRAADRLWVAATRGRGLLA